MQPSLFFLQHYWWFLVSLLGALLVFMLFVQGGQSLLYTLGRSGPRLECLLRMLGRKWELTFTTLVTFGGAFFAAFPLFYSTSFGGAYWVWMAILFSFVVQAVSYEYIQRHGNLLGRGGFKAFLFANGVLAPVLLGATVSTFFHGAEFVVNRDNLTSATPPISTWASPLHGLEAVGNPWNVALGIAILLLARALACLYFLNNIPAGTGGESGDLRADARRHLIRSAAGFLACFLPWTIRLLTMPGLGGGEGGAALAEMPFHYLHNFLNPAWLGALLLAGVALVLCGFLVGIFARNSTKGIWFAGPGTVLTVLSLLLCAGWNGTAYYPSLADPQSSLTLANSSSSAYTLTTMSVASLFIPVVLAYVAWVWRTLDRR
ncbi:MAG: cytochrome d ubiquinol oxidase subunit II [Puniceicoccales bacterium]|jgi:cytochrome d ubiquinol oxidase subunit II|nr:cytochrome d ubiquinol oxidase subunit II [Puniceicoccales bacterium]